MPENCTTCGGLGKIIVIDDEGKTHDVNCLACNGSGEKQG